ncbi:MAG: hypothetical protein KDA58_06225 [Planctomycetaceae bacterium]|nr:hypothetical protein [Planctomycetaceae bacterium]
MLSSCLLTHQLVVDAIVSAEDALPPPTVDGNATIRGEAFGSEIVITTTSRLAGAIHSLTWNGREFIDSVDHGRQLQSASNFDAGGPLLGETFNPTEAGSRRDGAGPISSSRLLHRLTAANSLQTTSQMAFWLAPEERSQGNPAKNRTILSNHLLTKRVTIGWRDMPHVVHYQVTFHVPIGETHRQGVFEVLTGYMPEDFSRFWRYSSEQQRLLPLDDGPGEQRDPVVLATEDGQYAMGCLAIAKESEALRGPGYGRFRFERERVVKWNCVFRLTDRAGISADDYVFETLVIVGDQATVESTIRSLDQQNLPLVP